MFDSKGNLGDGNQEDHGKTVAALGKQLRVKKGYREDRRVINIEKITT